MATLKDLDLLRRLLAEFNLPVSPILEYAIGEKEEELKKLVGDTVPKKSNERVRTGRSVFNPKEEAFVDNNLTPIFSRKIAASLLTKSRITIPSYANEKVVSSFGKELEKIGAKIGVTILLGTGKYQGYLECVSEQKGIIQLVVCEPAPYFERLRKLFRSSWNNIIYGKKPLEEYVAFFRTINNELKVVPYRECDTIPDIVLQMANTGKGE